MVGLTPLGQAVQLIGDAGSTGNATITYRGAWEK